MSYLVLARKWRPRRFAELVGQEHVVRALSNALGSGRVHHAFLFTGTRGVGKTTIARIFAKSLNCESGTSAEPCGSCDTCQAIDAGRYIDLLEIDAASNTGVDDVRELIDNAQYMPSRGRMKVYLIDEVHMLSKAAFNALLKTLEEPPGHVKFLLATTDPQKLPVTVLSRCLQFNLKRLDEAQIQGQVAKILTAEGIPAEAGAIAQIAKGADGSLRDGLSLLDQAIAYAGAGDGEPLTDAAVAAMLGSVDRARIDALLAALADGDGAALLAEVEVLSGFSPDWSAVLEAMAGALHRVQVRQLVPGADIDAPGIDVDALAARLRPELVQLWYQMALDGRRDLAYAPSPRSGFEMSLLRMLAFRPSDDGSQSVDAPAATPAARGPAAARAALDTAPAAAPRATRAMPEQAMAHANADVPVPRRHDAAPAQRRAPPSPFEEDAPRRRVPVEDPTRADAAPPRRTPPVDIDGAGPAPGLGTGASMQPSAPAPAPSPMPVASPEAAMAPPVQAAEHPGLDAASWTDTIAALPLRGPTRELALHAAFVGYDGTVLRLALPENEDHLRSPFSVDQLADALATTLGTRPQLRFESAVPAAAETLHARNARQRDERQASAQDAFMADPHVQRLVAQGARVLPDSIRPYED